MAGKKTLLDKFVDYLMTNGHENDYLDVIKNVYKISKNPKLLQGAARSDSGHLDYVVAAFCLYGWYATRYPKRKFFYEFDDVIHYFYSCIKDTVMDNKEDMSPQDEFDVIDMCGEAREYVNHVFDNLLLLEQYENGDLKYIPFRNIAKPLFKTLDSNPSIKLFIELPD